MAHMMSESSNGDQLAHLPCLELLFVPQAQPAMIMLREVIVMLLKI